MRFGVNTWVWTSPLTVAELETLAPLVASMGFDWIEAPLESLDDLDYERANEIIRANGLGVSCCVAMGPDRDLIHPDAAIRESGMAYVRGAIEATAALSATNLVGPLYATVGRTWQQTPEERAHDLDLLVENLSALAEYAAKFDVVTVPRAAQSLRDQLYQPGHAGDRGHRPCQPSQLPDHARYVPHEHRGEVAGRRDPRRRPAAQAPARLRKRPRRAGLRQCPVGRRAPGPEGHRLRRPGGDRVVHGQGQEHRPRRRHLARARADTG